MLHNVILCNRQPPLSPLSVSVTEAEDDEGERKVWHSRATPLLFRESLYSNYFQPAGDSLRFMRQLTDRPTRLGLARLEIRWLDIR